MSFIPLKQLKTIKFEPYSLLDAAILSNSTDTIDFILQLPTTNEISQSTTVPQSQQFRSILLGLLTNNMQSVNRLITKYDFKFDFSTITEHMNNKAKNNEDFNFNNFTNHNDNIELFNFDFTSVENIEQFDFSNFTIDNNNEHFNNFNSNDSNESTIITNPLYDPLAFLIQHQYLESLEFIFTQQPEFYQSTIYTSIDEIDDNDNTIES